MTSRKSKFGYKCFKVRFLTRSMHKDDWYPAIFVQEQLDGKKMRRGVLARLSSGGVPARVNPKAVRQAMRKNVLEIWEQVQEAARQNRRTHSASTDTSVHNLKVTPNA